MQIKLKYLYENFPYWSAIFSRELMKSETIKSLHKYEKMLHVRSLFVYYSKHYYIKFTLVGYKYIYIEILLHKKLA